MKYSSSFKCALAAWTLIAIGASAATTPTPHSHEAGGLREIYRSRTLPLQQPERWLGAQAATWSGRKADGPEISFSAVGAPFKLSGAISDGSIAATVLKEFVQSHKAAWGDLGNCDFVALNAWEFHGVWYVALQQTCQGIPVFGARLDGKLTQDGRLSAVSARLFPANQSRLAFALSAAAALRSLTDEVSARIDFSRQVLYPLLRENALDLRPAWQLRALTDKPDLRPAGVVDAHTGEVLLRYNDVAYDSISGNVSGLVLPAYWNEEPQAWDQKHQWVNVVNQGTIYTDTLGHYAMNGLIGGSYQVEGQLKGYFVDVENDDGEDASFSGTAYTTSPLNWTWDYDLARQDEANVYYHTDLVHGYFKSLDPSFTGLDFPLPVTVGYGTNYENAFWNGSGIFFGAGGFTFRNFALFSDVIYHEYGHGVTDHIYPEGMLPYTGQPGAMNEGWSDYFACTITNEPLIGEGGLMGSNQPLRNLDNNLIFPQNWSGEVHDDGRIFGGALWDLREMVGAGVTDSVAHFARYAWAENWEDYFVDVLVVDDDDGNLANGGPHHQEIYQAFGGHGIGPGVEPNLGIYPTEIIENGSGGSQGNGDGFFDPGEILSMTFSVTDFRYLYPPPALDVTVTASSDNPDLILQPLVFSLGEIGPGATVQAPESLLITVSPQANLDFSHIIFQISANGGAYQIADSIEIIVGHPYTVLIDDDAGAIYQQYLDASLRQYGQVFSSYNVAAQGPISLAFLNQFQVAVWLTGNDSVTTLTLDDQTTLAAFLDGGHNLLLTGQNLVEDVGNTPFFAEYLKAAPVAGDVNDVSLDGVPGDPISDSSWVLILGGGAAANQNSPASLSALPGAFEVYRYHADPTHRPAAVRYDAGTYKTITFGFGLEAVSGLGTSSTRSEVLSSCLAWFGLPTAVEPEPATSIPSQFAVGRPYPNPFNATTALSYQLSANSFVSLRVYDTSGRLVTTLADGWQEAGEHKVIFDGSDLASGMYFLNVRLEEENGGNVLSQVSKVILLK